MLFVAFAILIMVGIALAISADLGAVVGLTQNQAARIIPLLIILTLVASAVVGRRHRIGEIIAGFAIWAAIGALLILGYSYRDDFSRVGQRIMGELQPGVAIVEADGQRVRINRSFGGSFRVNTAINGVEVPMIFDTGATAVVLTRADARRVGIDIDRLSYTVPVQTANGLATAAGVTLDSMRIGSIDRSRIRAFVLPQGALETSLLGMTFLDTLSRFSVSQDLLELEN
ncbi:retropepsin-like aspartic protease family protein [Pelagibacterium lentulum]|uniref:TIGR02281 family clan AA aspartic protease n=1 Tax=Pelagibacterium lentulum TaxID=2029865 RepID=A0A916RBD4_9HYPH|nr:TIGR02281 family clan AA aspartic protease [Pelagibacterium lentulum]GGA49026.1 hypothetical protein GCM10011499_18590 [Pelagibacterium lentulum]